MNFGIFSYTATVLIFTSLALCLYFAMRFYISPKNATLSRTDWRTIVITIVVTILGTSPGEWTALAWRAWVYNPERTLHTTFLGAELETYLFTILVSLVVALATLLYARREDRRRDRELPPEGIY